MGAAAVPVAATLASQAAAPAVGAGLAGLTGAAASSIPAWLSSGLAGAAMGGIGSAILGENPLHGALLGGIGSGIGSAVLGDTFGSLFGGGVNPDMDLANEAISPALKAADSTLSNPVASSGGFWDSKVGKFLPYAGIGAAAMLADNAMAPEQVGPPLRPELKSGPVQPMDREYTEVDPLSYLTAGGNRSFFNTVNPPVKYYAKGGSAEKDSPRRKNEESAMMTRARMSGHPMEDTADFILGRYMKDKNYPGTWGEYMRDEYGDAPITREIIKIKKFANGGSSSASSMNIPEYGIGRRIRGRGDGMDDQIPAMLSDGEFVISAPVVSALGNGSNEAGARKLDKLQKQTLNRHYKGGKPKKSYGLGGYVH